MSNTDQYNGHELPRLLLAAPASGCGKTTVAMGLLRCFADRGLRPAAFKCGPDYIDPMFHREVLQVPGRNLDLYFNEPPTVRGLLRRGAAGAGVAVLESAMGYYDGIRGGDDASAWRMAVETQTPAVLVVPARGAFLSLAATVNGFVNFRTPGMIEGVIFNRCGEVLYDRLARMLESVTGVRAYGHIPEMPTLTIDSRHLGLVRPGEVAELRDRVSLLAEQMEKHLDLAGLVELARKAPPLADPPPEVRRREGAPVTLPVTLAVARDDAFCFYYEENLELLRDLGADLVFFSPLHDDALPAGVSGLYLGGGYPELHAASLAANASMRESVRDAVLSGLPTLAECGGFLYLQENLAGADGQIHPMAGALPGTSRDAGRLVRFGYLEMEALSDTLIAPRGGKLRAHEFHRWDSEAAGNGFAARKASGGDEWRFGVGGPNLYAGFPHLYFWNNPAAAERFVDAAIRRKNA